MRTKPLLAVALLAIASPNFAVAQESLPADWEQEVSAVVKDPDRARRVVETGRKYDATWQASLDAMKEETARKKATGDFTNLPSAAP